MKRPTDSIRLFIFLFWIIYIPSGFTQSIPESIDRLIMTEHPIEAGMAIMITKNRKPVYNKSFGQANIEHSIPVKSNSVFRIGSISKQFTAAAILQLELSGKLKVTDRVNQYITGFQDSVTIEHLLTHTAGVKDYAAIPSWENNTEGKELSITDLVNLFKTEELDFAPGTQHSYSNLGYLALGLIIENVANEDYNSFLKNTFFHPLGMASTQYDQTNEIISDRVSGYSKVNNLLRNSMYLDMKMPHGAGGLVSTVEDLSKWNHALLDNHVLNEGALRIAHTPYRLASNQLVPYGYGWEIGNIKGAKTIKHDGVINGFITYSMIIPEEDLSLVILTNCDCTNKIEEMASKIAAIAIEDPFTTSGVELNKERLFEYQGIYQSPIGHKKHLSYQDGSLIYHDKGGEKSILTPINKNTFIIDGLLTQLKFTVGTNGIMHMEVNDLNLPESWERISSNVLVIESINLSNEIRKEYIGKYQFPQAFVFTIEEKQGKMYGRVGNDSHEILPYEKDKFFAIDMDVELIFHRGETGKITEMTLLQAGEMKASRIDD